MQHILSLSYGKDSLACLGAIDKLGWPLDRAVTATLAGGKDLSWDNLERVKMGILCEAVALVLSGKLDELEEE